MPLRAVVLLTLSAGAVFAQEANTNVVPKEAMGAAINRAFYSPALPPVGPDKTMFVVSDPVTPRSPVIVLPVPKAGATPKPKADAPVKATSTKSDEQAPAKR
jgi:hypothetical protein